MDQKKKKVRKSNGNGKLQLAHNVSTAFSVGGRPRGGLPNTPGRNSAALSAEILIIDVRHFRKAKQPYEGNCGASSRSPASLHEAESIVTDLFILTTAI